MVQKSKFSYKDLARMKNYSVDSPLRVIAHIDLDAFYAQCETVRLGINEEEPLAVAQWANLIAINYPARATGLSSRHANVQEAKKICPNLHVVHVATWKAGDTKWSYRENSADEISTSKACLDPYRIESKKILAIFRAHCDRVEKASIDESFLDLSALVSSRLLERYPEFLVKSLLYDNPTERLPLPPNSAINWINSNLINLSDDIDEEEYPDWDDVCMGVASEIVADIRREVREQLKYTSSAGIACNKMLAKLASGQKKPNNQTVVRNRAISQFLSKFKFTKIRNLGGKLGQEIANHYNTDSVAELLKIPLHSFVQTLHSEESAVWLFNTIRGSDKSEVNTRTSVKSMLSAKSFRPVINSHRSALEWLRIFVADICSRMEEEGVMTGTRRPKTMTIHHRSFGVAKNRQIPIPSGKDLGEETMMGLAVLLLRQVEAEGGAYPCSALSLQVARFEEKQEGNKNITRFLVRTDLVEKPREKRKPRTPGEPEDMKSSKKIKVPIEDFLPREDQESEIGTVKNQEEREDSITQNGIFHQAIEESIFDELSEDPEDSVTPTYSTSTGTTKSDCYTCPICNLSIDIFYQVEHTDWHFAMELMKEEREKERQRLELEQGGKQNQAFKKSAYGRRRIGSGNSGREKGQKTLEYFGGLGKHDRL